MLSLPKFITASNCKDLLPIFEDIQYSNDAVIDLDASNTEYVDPLGMCFMAAFCDKLHLQDKRVQLVNLQEHLQSYLSRMDLLERCGNPPANTQHRNNLQSTLLEVQCLQDQDEVAQAASRLSAAVVGNTPDYDEDAEPDEMTGHKPHENLQRNLEYVFNELLENSLTHARRHGYDESKVWLASQYYGKGDVIKTGIVDTGCGFRRSLASHPERPDTDLDAIKLALEPRVSCNRDVGVMPDSYNQGVGLTVTCRMIREAKGIVNLVSGTGYIKGRPDKLISSELESNWHGVGIGLEVRRGELKRLEVQQVIHEITHETGLSETPAEVQFI